MLENTRQLTRISDSVFLFPVRIGYLLMMNRLTRSKTWVCGNIVSAIFDTRIISLTKSSTVVEESLVMNIMQSVNGYYPVMFSVFYIIGFR